MADNNTERVSILGRNYGITLSAGKDIILDRFVKQVRILNDADAIWPQFMIQIDIDALEIIKNDVYGQNTMILTIYRCDQSNAIRETTRVELICLESDLTMTPRYSSPEEPHADIQTTILMCIPLHAYNMMSTFVNFLIQEGDDVLDGVTLLKKILIDVYKFDKDRVKIDEREKNQGLISQLLIPPMLLKDAVKFINTNFYLYNGPLFNYADMDGNFLMWNMHKKIQDNPVLDIYLLSASGSNNGEVQKLFDNTENKSVMIASTVLKTAYNANLMALNTGYNITYTTHPGSDLYENVSANLDVIAQLGAASELQDLDQLKIHPALKNQKRYIHNFGGTNVENNSIGLLTSKLSTKISKLSSIVVTLKGNIYFQNIFKVGHPITLNGMSEEYATYNGKYILWKSDIILSRLKSDNWLCDVGLILNRTNQSSIKRNQDRMEPPVSTTDNIT